MTRQIEMTQDAKVMVFTARPNVPVSDTTLLAGSPGGFYRTLHSGERYDIVPGCSCQWTHLVSLGDNIYAYADHLDTRLVRPSEKNQSCPYPA